MGYASDEQRPSDQSESKAGLEIVRILFANVTMSSENDGFIIKTRKRRSHNEIV